LLVYDETHTISAGPGGCVGAWDLTPDIVTIGKSLGAGVPVAAYGVSQAVLDRIEADDEADYFDWGGVGGTLAGNALSLAATRATLAEVLTDEAFVGMTELATRYREGVQAAIDRHALPWCIVQLGARAEYHFYPEPPVSGGQAEARIDAELDDDRHLSALNRGIVMTPFHNMALMCPATTAADVDRHTVVFDQALAELIAR
jgi:glutamate-1-semialdehyde 2,1-aminomutase